LKKSRYFAIQLNESTDMTNCAILCFVCYMEKEDFKEELLLTFPGRRPATESDLLKNTVVRKKTAKTVSECAQMGLQA